MGIGKRIGGSARGAYAWADVVTTYYDVLPAYPGANILDPYRHPAPPLLDKRLSKHKQAVELARAYTSTMRHFVRRPWEFKSPLKHDRSYVLLLEVVPLFIEGQIPPQAWVKFSLDAFMKHVRNGVPKPNWVFSKKRLTERLDWFSWEQSFNTAQCVVWVASEHRKLLRLYEKMKRELLAQAKLTPSLVQEIRDRILPFEEYTRLYEKAQMKYSMRKSKIESALDRGLYIW